MVLSHPTFDLIYFPLFYGISSAENFCNKTILSGLIYESCTVIRHITSRQIRNKVVHSLWPSPTLDSESDFDTSPMDFYRHCRNRSAWALPHNCFQAVCFSGLFLKTVWWTTGPLVVPLIPPSFGLGFEARVDSCLHASLPACNEFLRFTFGAIPADLFVATMAAEPFLIHVLAHVFRTWSGQARRTGFVHTWLTLTPRPKHPGTQMYPQCQWRNRWVWTLAHSSTHDIHNRWRSHFQSRPALINHIHILLRKKCDILEVLHTVARDVT